MSSITTSNEVLTRWQLAQHHYILFWFAISTFPDILFLFPGLCYVSWAVHQPSEPTSPLPANIAFILHTSHHWAKERFTESPMSISSYHSSAGTAVPMAGQSVERNFPRVKQGCPLHPMGTALPKSTAEGELYLHIPGQVPCSEKEKRKHWPTQNPSLCMGRKRWAGDLLTSGLWFSLPYRRTFH